MIDVVSNPSNAAMDFSLFEATPGMRLVYLPDAPRFTIIAATRDLCQHLGLPKNQIVGKGVFEAFPSNRSDPSDTGETALQASLMHVLQYKEPHELPVQRYDVKEENECFTKYYWKAANFPVINHEGEVAYIIHTTEDITDKVIAGQKDEAHQQLETAYQRLKESEDKYRSLFESMDHGFCVLEILFDVDQKPLDHRFVEVNPMFEKQSGLKNAVGKTARALVPNLERHWSERYGEVALTGVPIRFSEGSEALGRWFDVYAFRVGEPESRKVALLFTDITERKQSEKALGESEERFRQLADDSPMFVFLIEADPTAPVNYWNKTWLEYTGQSLEEAKGSAWNGIIHPDDVPVVMAYYTPAFQKKEAYFIPAVRVKRHDGVYRWHAFKGNPRYLPTGEFNGYVGVGFDIHEQKLAEQALKQSEEQLQLKVAERTHELETQKAFFATILEASMNGIYALKAVHNSDGLITDFQYLFANNNIAKLLNLGMREIIGSSMLALIPENRTNGFFDLFCKLLQTGETHRGDTHFVAQSIDSWYEYVIVPIDKETLVVSIEDITDKKQAVIQLEEQRNLLDSILKNSSNGISVSKVFRDDKGNVVDALTILANDAAVKYIGLPRDIYLSKRATEIEPTIIGSPYYQSCIKTLETGEPFVMQYQMQSTRRWLELTVSRLDQDHLIHIFTDVTSIKETQLQLEEYVEELKRSNQNLEEFAYAASHDLKEPARKIVFFADRLKQELQEQMSEEQNRLFTRMQSAGQRMGLLIDDLLTYSHVSRGASIMELVDLNKKVQLVLEDLELEIQEKGATITVDKLPTITGHKRQMQQVFQNLIGNALKYSMPGVHPQIHIRTKVVHGNAIKRPLSGEAVHKQYHLIEVRDNGIGFSQQDAERIFNVFTRLHGNSEYKGSGVGLSIVRKVLENHHGFIWAESHPGEGATFTMLLPTE